MTRSTRLRTLPIAFLGLVSMVVLVSASGVENPEHTQQAKTTKSCVQCDLSSADLSGLQAPKGDFTGANFSSAKLYKADLSDGEFNSANFLDADLTGANLEGAKHLNLTGAKTTERTTCPDGEPGPCK